MAIQRPRKSGTRQADSVGDAQSTDVARGSLWVVVFEVSAATRCRAPRYFPRRRNSPSDCSIRQGLSHRRGLHAQRVVAAMCGSGREQQRVALLPAADRTARSYGEAGVNPLNSPTEVYVINYPWGQVPDLRTDQGCDVCVFFRDAPCPQHPARHAKRPDAIT